jgi:hypothetical protein
LQLADLRAVARRAGDRALCPSHSVLGQRDPLRWQRAELAPPFESGRARGHRDRQTAFQERRDNGFTQEIMPLHVVDGIGDPLGWLRDPPPVRKAALRLANDAERSNSNYQDYDDKITAAAVDWLKVRA